MDDPLPIAIARYYFYSVTGAVAPLLNLTSSGSGSDAINKVAVAHLWLALSHFFCVWVFITKLLAKTVEGWSLATYS